MLSWYYLADETSDIYIYIYIYIYEKNYLKKIIKKFHVSRDVQMLQEFHALLNFNLIIICIIYKI